jgi:hypothetical protein
MNRRKYLAAVGATTSLGLSGCSGGTGGNNSSGGNSTETAGNGAETTATNTDVRTGGSDATTADTETEAATETGTEAETDTEMATETEMQTATPSGGGEGSLEVVESELVVNEGQYTTDIAMTGLLENTGNGVLRIPEIEVTFYDDSDSVLSNTTRSIVFLEPGDQWDVRVSYLEDTDPARGEIEVTSTEVYQTELGIPAPLELTEENLETGAEPTITATLQNTSDSPVDAVAFGVFYAEGSVALGGALDTLNGLAGGESWSVTLDSLITREERAQRVTDYTLYANVP